MSERSERAAAHGAALAATTEGAAPVSGRAAEHGALPRGAGAAPGRPADRGASEPPAGSERVVPRRHPGRWVATAVVLVLLAQFIHGLWTNPFYQWDRFAHWFVADNILRGLVITLEVTVLSAVFGLLGGIVLALMRLSRSPVLRAVSWGYVWLFRSIPLIVLLIFLNNFSAVYTHLGLGIPFGPQFVTFKTTTLGSNLAIAVLGLTLNEAAFAAEIVRGGVLSVDAGQTEAASALGLPRGYTFRRIVLPQALRSIVPNYVNQLIGIIKGSSLVYYVSLIDVFGAVETTGSTFSSDIVPLLLVGTVWYVILTTIVAIAQYYVERAFAHGSQRTIPPTPWQRVRAAAGGLGERARAERASRAGATGVAR